MSKLDILNKAMLPPPPLVSIHLYLFITSRVSPNR